MRRRDVLRKMVTVGTTLATGGLMLPQVRAEEGFLDLVFWPSARDTGGLVGKAERIVRNVRSMGRGLATGYGLAVQQILHEHGVPLPTEPHRDHPAWPHLHCFCHCVATASLGVEEGSRWSMWAGLQDEMFQGWIANLFRTQVYPMIYADVAQYHDERNPHKGIRLEVNTILNYVFGTEIQQKRALAMASVKNKARKEELIEFRKTVYSLVDACESAWQRSDFIDNAIGRAGGCQCAGRKSKGDRVAFCRTWCTDHGVPSDCPEGPSTDRPWSPYHLLDPGPVPTYHEVMFGDIIAPFSPLLNQPHPLYVPPEALIDPPVIHDLASRE